MEMLEKLESQPSGTAQEDFWLDEECQAPTPVSEEGIEGPDGLTYYYINPNHSSH